MMDSVETWSTSNHTIWVNSVRHNPETFDLNDSIFIHNNTVVLNKPFSNGVHETSVTIDGDHTYVYNNIFTSTNGAATVSGHISIKKEEVGNSFNMTNNLFYGNVNEAFIAEDASPIKADPKFIGTGDNKSAYMLNDNSPAINKGVAIKGPIVANAGYGVFKDIAPYPTVDLYGNPVDLISGKMNIGAYNGKPTDTSALDKKDNTCDWLVYPDSSKTLINVISKGDYSGELEVELFNLKGQLITKEIKDIDPTNNQFNIALNSNISNGIYILNFKGDELSHSRRIVLYR